MKNPSTKELNALTEAEIKQEIQSTQDRLKALKVQLLEMKAKAEKLQDQSKRIKTYSSLSKARTEMFDLLFSKAQGDCSVDKAGKPSYEVISIVQGSEGTEAGKLYRGKLEVEYNKDESGYYIGNFQYSCRKAQVSRQTARD